MFIGLNYAVVIELFQFTHHCTSVNGEIIRKVCVIHRERKAFRAAFCAEVFKEKHKLFGKSALFKNIAVGILFCIGAENKVGNNFFCSCGIIIAVFQQLLIAYEADLGGFY